ncbi:amino acid transporter [Fragilariopsis cylindrus CCMP1102]|uniref:Amino acid transporter n=1 Tax=Fragilariopsis cylindrus CCMP1102 TaxID=635003 RepID=A0A1E7F6E1_9STRA|nr:amino acid transporter [Fragilariopsis cylindrus CCMP1102]|eukprot:OEU13752.1 amino acid transporter [Fragilariopsis cylindrus CCMP1102]
MTTTLESISDAITRRKPLSRRNSTVNDDGNEKDDDQHGSLKRTLGVTDLILYGIGCSVGAGIYSLVGIGARTAGPAISMSFAVCGIACCFTSLAYAEFAARVPMAGSAYTFTYVSFGELAGWLVGWNLTLGYAVSAAAVSRSWAVYTSNFFHGWLQHLNGINAKLPTIFNGQQPYECCPLAAVVILLCTSILVTGAKESARFNTAMTILNLAVLGFVVVIGWTTGSVRHDNLFTPSFFPEGLDGVARAAGLVFFSYLGFDMVSCLSEEVIDPERNMPIGIVGSLVASTFVYFIVSLTCLSYSSCEPPLGNNSSFTFSLLLVGSRVVSIGAIFGLTTATFACLMGQPRIFFSMAQDGLLFKIYGRINPKTGVPTAGTVLTGIMTAFVACFINLESLANTISLGTLQVFSFVNAGVIVLRMTPPLTSIATEMEDNVDGDREQNGNKPYWLTLVITILAVLSSMGFSRRWPIWIWITTLGFLFVSIIALSRLSKGSPPDTFSCPWVPAVPLLGILCNSFMMGSMPLSTWSAISAWLLVGVCFYFSYGIHNSALRKTTIMS